jgi:hypothetical protein
VDAQGPRRLRWPHGSPGQDRKMGGGARGASDCGPNREGDLRGPHKRPPEPLLHLLLPRRAMRETIGKTQAIRVLDVMAIGPAMIWGGDLIRPRHPGLGWFLIVSGIGTVVYNAHNLRRQALIDERR